MGQILNKYNNIDTIMSFVGIQAVTWNITKVNDGPGRCPRRNCLLLEELKTRINIKL